MGPGMNLLAWLTGTWKAGAWKAGAWQAEETPPEFPQGGAFLPRRVKDPRKKREDEELLLFYS